MVGWPFHLEIQNIFLLLLFEVGLRHGERTASREREQNRRKTIEELHPLPQILTVLHLVKAHYILGSPSHNIMRMVSFGLHTKLNTKILS